MNKTQKFLDAYLESIDPPHPYAITQPSIRYGDQELFTESLRFVCEETFKMSKSVDKLYDIHMKSMVDSYHTNPEQLWRVSQNAGGTVFSKTDSSVLTEHDILIKAHQKNPITIQFGLLPTNYNSMLSMISVGISVDAVRFLGVKGLNNEVAVKQIPTVVNEFEEIRIKALIAHELTHWIDDTLHNQKVIKATDKYLQSLGTDETENERLTNEYQFFSELEVQAIVNEISNTRDNQLEEYSRWSWNDLKREHMALNVVMQKAEETLSKEERSGFMKLFLRRMSRENLITPNMLDDLNRP